MKWHVSRHVLSLEGYTARVLFLFWITEHCHSHRVPKSRRKHMRKVTKAYLARMSKQTMLCLKKLFSFYQKNKTLVLKPPPSNFSSTEPVELCWDVVLINKISQLTNTISWNTCSCLLPIQVLAWLTLLNIEIRWNHSSKHYVEN